MSTHVVFRDVYLLFWIQFSLFTQLVVLRFMLGPGWPLMKINSHSTLISRNQAVALSHINAIRSRKVLLTSVSAIIENKGKLISASMGEVSQVLTTVAAKILKNFLNINA